MDNRSGQTTPYPVPCCQDGTPSWIRPQCWLLWLAIMMGSLVLAGCNRGGAPVPVTSTPVPTLSTVAPTSAEEDASPPPARQEIPPLAVAEASPPARLRIPVVGMDVPVVAMTWQITVIGGIRTTQWTLPMEAAGWHVNSAPAGAVGNVVVSGHHLLGEAVFRPITLGDVTVGQEIYLEDEAGRVFVYRVREVTEPVPIEASLAQERALAEQYTSQRGEARLTLVTGWPDYAATHRIFVVADFLGRLEQ